MPRTGSVMLARGGRTRGGIEPATGSGNIKHLVLFLHLYDSIIGCIGAIAVVVIIIGMKWTIRMIARVGSRSWVVDILMS